MAPADFNINPNDL